MDFSNLQPNQRRELGTVFSDEFCHCGCPHTLGQCLRGHPQCKHAKRMAGLAARHAEAGFPGSEIILILSRYYDGFRAPRKKLEVDPRMCMGSEKAEITLVEFFDYECPACAAVAPVLKDFAKKYGAKVRFCAVPFVLPSHPNSQPATQAALMARDAGKFWALHDKLLENQLSLSPSAIRELAASVGLSGEEVAKAIASGKHVDQINAYKGLGRSAGVEATPSLYLNGRKFQLDLSEQNLVHTVDDELDWARSKGGWAAD